MSTQDLFRRLFDLTSEDLEECTAELLTRNRLSGIARKVIETEPSTDSPDNGTGDPFNEDDETASPLENFFRQNDLLIKEGVSIMQRRKIDLLKQIFRRYDDGQKGHLVPEDMRHLMHDYLLVLRGEAPSQVVQQALKGAKLGLQIAAKNSEYMKIADIDLIEQELQKLMMLIRPEVEKAVSELIERLLRPANLERVSTEIFFNCDDMTRDGWVSELEFQNCFLHAVSKAIEWNTVLQSANRILQKLTPRR